MIDLRAIEASLLDASAKGYPHRAPPCALRDIATRGWNVMRGDLPFPIALLKETALAHNLAWMADFTRRTGVLLAPHGKTTMAPQLFARQLAAGAWGITFANMQQVSLAVSLGMRRIILANQLVGREDITQARELMASTSDLELLVLVDSVAGVALLEAHGAPRGQDAPFSVLLEMGLPGGRTGCRTSDEALHVARAIAECPATRLSGVECFEGLDMTADDVGDRNRVDRWIQTVHAVARLCDVEELYGTPEVTLSAGGSAVFDLVARGLPIPLSRPVRTILRCGCYLTHDSGMYTRYARTMRVRNGDSWLEGEGLEPALEIWTHVQSRPEPGLAILAFGKRDASFDIDLPVPLARTRDGESRAALDSTFRIVKLNDQHAYMEVPADADVRVGDLVGCGISHPCTTFDKWRWMPIVDDRYSVTGAVRTFF